MKWNYKVIVVCAFTGILSALADEDATTDPSTTPIIESTDETTQFGLESEPSTTTVTPETEAPTTSAPEEPVATSIPPEVTESVNVQSTATPDTSGDGVTTISGESGVDVSPTTGVPENDPVTDASASETPETTAATSEAPEDVQTTTADSWFSWMYSSKSDNGPETTEAGTTTEMSPTTSDENPEQPTTTETPSPELGTSTTPESGRSAEVAQVSSTAATEVSALERSQGVAFKLSDQVRAILQHYKSPDPTGFPGAPIPDPMPIPDMVRSFGVAKMTFNQVSVYGLSKFRIEQVNTDLEKMQVYVQLYMKRLVVIGNYTLRSWFNKAAGPFTVNLYDVMAEGAAALEPDEQGHLQASDSDMDMTFKDINLDFKNMGFAGSFFQGMVGSVGTFLFDSIKPYILNEVNTNMRRDVNAKIKTITSKLPSYVSPVDMAVSEGRKYVVKMGYDPYHLKDFEFQESILRINVSELWLKGLSQFYRVNDISLSIDKNVVQIAIQLVTKQLAGSCSWSVALGRRGKLSRSGVSNFTAEHLQIRAFVNQSLDIRHGPILADLDLEVGKVKLTMDGRGSLDYVIEIVVNQLPDLIRHIIVDALEDPIRNKVQDIFNQVNLEEIVESELPKLDSLS